MNVTAESLSTMGPLMERLASADKRLAATAVELALLRCEAARRETNTLFDRFRGREPTDEEDQRLADAMDAYERAEAELKRAASDALGVDVVRVMDALS